MILVNVTVFFFKSICNFTKKKNIQITDLIYETFSLNSILPKAAGAILIFSCYCCREKCHGGLGPSFACVSLCTASANV